MEVLDASSIVNVRPSHIAAGLSSTVMKPHPIRRPHPDRSDRPQTRRDPASLKPSTTNGAS